MRWISSLFSPGRIILVASVIAAVYLAVSAGSNYLDSFQLEEDENQLRAELAVLQGQEDQLLQIREYLRSDAYIEFMARKVFGLVKPGETLVIIDAPPAANPAGAAGKTWWERLFNP